MDRWTSPCCYAQRAVDGEETTETTETTGISRQHTVSLEARWRLKRRSVDKGKDGPLLHAAR